MNLRVLRDKSGRARERSVRAVRWGLYLLILLPVGLSVAYVNEYGVSVIVRDQWEMVTYFRILSEGRLPLSEIWEPHNEHRFFFPRIAMLALGTVTEWNNLAEMYLIQACLFVTLVCLWFAFKTETRLGLLLFVPIAFMVFSVRQSLTMLSGYQVTFAFAQTFSVLALCLLYVSSGRTDRKRFAFPASLASATIAAFSAIQGLLVWPAGLVQLLVAPLERPAKRIMIAVWSMTGLGVWVVYFLGHEQDAVSPSAGPVDRLASGARHFTTLLGNALFMGNKHFSQLSFASANGVFLLLLAAVSLILVYRYGRLGEFRFWLSLLAFSLLVLLSVTAGRSDLGVANAATPRYIPFSILVAISIYALLVELRAETRNLLTSVLLGVLLVVIVLGIPLSYKNGNNKGLRIQEDRQEAALVLSTYESQPDERLKTLHKNPENVKLRAPVLREFGYNVFSDD